MTGSTEATVGPTLLIASPQMTDPFFEKTVVLLWHHDEEGAIGVVVNRRMPQSLSEVVTFEGGPSLDHYRASRVAWGGPVDTDTGTVVTTGGLLPGEGWALECGLAVTRSQEALARLVEARADVLLCIGYAGWGPGQLDHEILEGGWLSTDVAPELVLSADPDHAWEQALATLGLTPSTVWMTPIDE